VLTAGFLCGVFDDFSPSFSPAPLLYRAKSLKCERPSAVLMERKGQQTCHIVNRFREELCATDHTGLQYIDTRNPASHPPPHSPSNPRHQLLPPQCPVCRAPQCPCARAEELQKHSEPGPHASPPEPVLRRAARSLAQSRHAWPSVRERARAWQPGSVPAFATQRSTRIVR